EDPRILSGTLRDLHPCQVSTTREIGQQVIVYEKATLRVEKCGEWHYAQAAVGGQEQMFGVTQKRAEWLEDRVVEVPAGLPESFSARPGERSTERGSQRIDFRALTQGNPAGRAGLPHHVRDIPRVAQHLLRCLPLESNGLEAPELDQNR